MCFQIGLNVLNDVSTQNVLEGREKYCPITRNCYWQWAKLREACFVININEYVGQEKLDKFALIRTNFFSFKISFQIIDVECCVTRA